MLRVFGEGCVLLVCGEGRACCMGAMCVYLCVACWCAHNPNSIFVLASSFSVCAVCVFFCVLQ